MIHTLKVGQTIISDPCAKRNILLLLEKNNIYTSLSIDPYTTFDLEYLTSAATTGPGIFFLYFFYSYIGLQEYTKSPFIRVC